MSILKYYKLRIDTHDKSFVESMCKKYFDFYLYAFENVGEENPHVHLYIESTTKPATIRNHIRKNVGSGNGIYSLKELDEERPIEYLAYCCKERDYSTNLPAELIENALSYDAQVKADMKEKKKSRRTVLQQIDESLNMTYSEIANVYVDPNGRVLNKEQIVEHVIKYYQETETLVRQFQLVSISQTLCLKYVPSYDYELKNDILSKI